MRLDEEKGSLRILMLLYVRRDRSISKMRLRGVAEKVGVSKSRFDTVMKELQRMDLVHDRVERIDGKHGITKYPELTSLGVLVAEKLDNLDQLFRNQ